MASTNFALPFASHLWQCAQAPHDKRGHFSPAWDWNLFQDFCPGEVVAVDFRSNLRHCHALLAENPSELRNIGYDELRAGLSRLCRGRVLLRLPDEGIVSFSRSRLTRVLPSTPKRVLVVNETISYRRLAKTQVGKADGVLEIGSSFGECTQILTKHAKSVVGIDNSPELVEESRRRYPFCRIELLNCFHERERLLQLCSELREETENFKVFVDIGGDRSSTAVCRVLVFLDDFFNSLSGVSVPSLVVVKSQGLSAAAAECCDPTGNMSSCDWWHNCAVPSSLRQRRKWGVAHDDKHVAEDIVAVSEADERCC
eukprot:Skav233948  [mRNA]  locus=scaffold1382:151583:152521:+ [translate_table: standard]